MIRNILLILSRLLFVKKKKCFALKDEASPSASQIHIKYEAVQDDDALKLKKLRGLHGHFES